MFHKLKKPSPALVVSFIALFVAMSGVGYTASRLNGKRLKNRTVAGVKLKRNTVRGTEIRESSLGQVPSAERADVATVADTATTALNVAVASTITPVRQVHAFSTPTTAANQYRTAVASCNANEKAISGGGGWVLTNSTNVTGVDAQINGTRPEPATEGSDNATGWRAYGRNNTAIARRVLAVAFCVPKT